MRRYPPRRECDGSAPKGLPPCSLLPPSSHPLSLSLSLAPRVSPLDLISPASKRDCWTPIITDPVVPQWPLVSSLSSRDLTGSPCRVTEQRRFSSPIGSYAINEAIVVLYNNFDNLILFAYFYFPNINFSPDFGL